LKSAASRGKVKEKGTDRRLLRFRFWVEGGDPTPCGETDGNSCQFSKKVSLSDMLSAIIC
jgi:hypothetical protein